MSVRSAIINHLLYEAFGPDKGADIPWGVILRMDYGHA